MSASLRRFGPVLLAGLFAFAALAAQAEGQGLPPTTGAPSANLNRLNPSRQAVPDQAPGPAANTAAVGRPSSQVPPSALGPAPYPPPAPYGPSYPAITPSLPPPVFDPGYAASLVPGGLGSAAAYGANPYYNGAAFNPAAGALYGTAALTAANGQYYQSIQSARIAREQSRQMGIETRRQQLQFELEYERMKPTAQTMIARERANELNWARHYASANDIWTGRALNVLARSAIDSGRLAFGPNLPLDGYVLKGINLKDKNQRGSIGLLKDGGKLSWPLPLQDERFDEPRDRLNKNLTEAGERLTRYGEAPNLKTVRVLRADLKELDERLDDAVKTMPPSDWIVGRRYLNRLKETITALNEPTVATALDKSWLSKVNNVAQLLTYVRDKNLEFAPAAVPSDNAAYTALYYPLRAFEGAVQVARK
jgi:hypothetical protein